MAEFENKYIVIKISDYEKWKKEADEEDIYSFEEMLIKIDNQNEYVVINRDEPYAKAVLDIILAFESLKEKLCPMLDGPTQ
ncbi:MAG: hypothetical protein SVV88_08755 [Pseudomonadota bacterium]|nr:hypothetical protein [Pseudomonadota bacterium]